MGEQDVRRTVHPERDHTDESLRVERDKADSRDAETRDAVEEQADEVVRIARQRADEVVRRARHHADVQRHSELHDTEASFESPRSDADVVLDHERSIADALLERERAERRRYLADFVAIEREATDGDLIGERAYADTAVAARDEFLATVSHDLRSLLNSLALNESLLVTRALEGGHDDRLRMHAATGQRIMARMNRLIGDLVDVASIEAGKLALVPEQVEVTDILRDTLDAFEPIAAAKGVTLVADAATRKLRARVDGGRILQVLANLVSNAIKFTPAEGRVALRIGIEDGAIHFAVSDTGIGIPEDSLQAVFERFRQVGGDRRGLGLGLHISKSIIEAHGGRMWAESTLAAGSTFHFALPASLSSAGEADRASRDAMAAGSAG